MKSEVKLTNDNLKAALLTHCDLMGAQIDEMIVEANSQFDFKGPKTSRRQSGSTLVALHGFPIFGDVLDGQSNCLSCMLLHI